MTDRSENIPPAQQCFLCFGKLNDGSELVTVGLGFDVHKDCYESDDDD